MSWLNSLAGRAEDILNKLDQNAATVLSIQQEEENSSINLNNEKVSSSSTTLVEINTDESGAGKLLTLPRTASPLKLRSIKSEASIKSADQQVNGGSSRSSRRSSFSSKQDGNGTVIEKQISTTMTPKSTTGTVENVGLQMSSTGSVSVEQELAALKIVLAEIKSERDELKSENDNLMDQVKNTSSEARIKELEDFCLEIEGERDELLEKLNALEISTAKYIKSISELEIVISKLQQHDAELRQKLEWSIQEKEQAITELSQYRTRAQSSLQAKEKMIEELKLGSVNGISSQQLDGQKLEELDRENRKHELENLRVENESLNQQLSSLKFQLDQIKNQFTNGEENFRSRLAEMNEKYEKIGEKFKFEQNRNRELELDVKAKAQELSSVRDEIVRLRSNMSKKMYEKDLEITKIKERISNQSDTMTGNGIEERLQSLTQSLVQKQTALESLTAERNALRLQLEKIENQHRTTMLQLRQQRPQIVNMNNVTDDGKSELSV